MNETNAPVNPAVAVATGSSTIAIWIRCAPILASSNCSRGFIVDPMDRWKKRVETGDWDAIATTKAPVIASHSSARALVNAPRNMTDDMLRAVAKNGGVVQVNFFSGFLDEDYRKAVEAQAKDQAVAIQKYIDSLKAQGKAVSYVEVDRMERAWMAKIPRPPFNVLIDHIDHIAKIAGVDHVGLGSDFDGVSGATPRGMDSAADLPKITQALLDRVYSAEDIKKILGGNLLRVFRQVETVRHELQSQSH